MIDLMPAIRARLAHTGLRNGSVNLISRHTTTAVMINEWESRLVRDVRAWYALRPFACSSGGTVC